MLPLPGSIWATAVRLATLTVGTVMTVGTRTGTATTLVAVMTAIGRTGTVTATVITTGVIGTGVTAAAPRLPKADGTRLSTGVAGVTPEALLLEAAVRPLAPMERPRTMTLRLRLRLLRMVTGGKRTLCQSAHPTFLGRCKHISVWTGTDSSRIVLCFFLVLLCFFSSFFLRCFVCLLRLISFSSDRIFFYSAPFSL